MKSSNRMGKQKINVFLLHKFVLMISFVFLKDGKLFKYSKDKNCGH